MGVACKYTHLGVFPMRKPYEFTCLKGCLWCHVFHEWMGVPMVKNVMSEH